MIASWWAASSLDRRSATASSSGLVSASCSVKNAAVARDSASLRTFPGLDRAGDGRRLGVVGDKAQAGQFGGHCVMHDLLVVTGRQGGEVGKLELGLEG